ncbi:Peptidyl-prolyl cis-trans isomerase cyp10 [Tilletia horrida]|nr:Peptidyl-prolyl cis-trans isomerase cyp10 [Tilletia horrida]
MSVTFHTTSGDLKIEVFCETVPRAAENFLGLCAAGAYDGTLWHRNIKGEWAPSSISKFWYFKSDNLHLHPGFMIQTGDPTGTGKGGQSIWGRPFPDEIRSTVKVSIQSFNSRGIVAMANSGPDTNKAQFFVTYQKTPHLDGKYTIIGKVIDGAGVGAGLTSESGGTDEGTLDAMEKVPVDEKHRPTKGNEIKTLRVTLHANPIALKKREEGAGRAA